MKKLIALSLLLVACHKAPSSGPTPENGPLGAADPKSAVGAFIAAINAQDLQAMSAVWGDADGSIRNQIGADELMKREVVIIQMLKCVRKDFTVISNSVAGTNQRAMVVDLNFNPPPAGRASVTRSTSFVVASDKKTGRWFVSSIEPNKINDICLSRGG